MEIGKTGVSAFVYVDSEMNYLEGERNSELLKHTVHPEDLVQDNDFLMKNKDELKKLYRATKKQYDVVNGQ